MFEGQVILKYINQVLLFFWDLLNHHKYSLFFYKFQI